MYLASTPNRQVGVSTVIILLIMLISGNGSSTDHPDIKGKKDNSTLIRSTIKSTRGYSRFGKGNETLEDGNVRYFRSTIVDGNLVTGAITNNGLLSHANLSIPPLSWPKGPKVVDYIFATFFYVASEVVDAHGDTIAIVSDYFRFGEEAPDQTHTYHFMPLPKYFNLDEPDALTEPLIGGISEDVGLDGLPNTNDPGEGDGILQPIEDFNNNGVLDLHMQNVVGWFATSSRKETWPEYWPVGSYPGDTRQPGQEVPGVRAGRWNGEFGAYVRGDQETYYFMDDRENDEFDYYPFPGDTAGWPTGRRGLGITVKARTYQWNARLAEDILINIYDTSKPLEAKDLDKCVVGMLVDPDMGGQYWNDDADYNTLDDITYTWNIGGRDLETGLPIGYFGFAFLESPGLSFDGIDNDQDGMTDESQSNGIDDDGDWTPWEDLDGNGVFDNEDTNYNLILDLGEDLNSNGILDIEPLHDDKGSDGLGPEDFEYGGPDPDGTEANGVADLGEPNFETTDNDESDQVGLTSAYFKPHSGWMDDDQTYWDEQLQPGTFDRTSDWQTDVAFTYGSGFVEFKNDSTVTPAKGATHRYAIALAFGNDEDDILRNKTTIQVIYDNDYNFAKAPLQPTLTAMGGDKKVFLKWDDIAERSTDPIYGRDFEAYYIYKSTDPTFEEIKTITDAFGNPLLFKPLAIFDLDNGLQGLHPVRLGSELGGSSDLGVTYNMGTDSGLRHNFVDEDVINGRTYYYAVASLDQGYYHTFYDDSISSKPSLNPIAPTECPVNIQIDPLGRPIAFDRNTAQVIPTEMSAGWIDPYIGGEGIDHVSGFGTGRIEIQFYNPLEVKTNHSYRVEFNDNGEDVQFDSTLFTGTLNQMTVKSLTEGTTLGVFDKPANNDFDEKYIFEGFRVLLYNDTTNFDTAFWAIGSSPLEVDDDRNTPGDKKLVQRDYEIRIMDKGADTSQGVPWVTNFQIFDVTDSDSTFKISNFIFRDFPPSQRDTILNELDRISIIDPRNINNALWEFEFDYPAGTDSSLRVPPQKGDVLKILTRKTFDRHDAFEFTVSGNSISDQRAKRELENIFVVPDPYIAVNRLERKVFNPEEGRGERRIDFVNLPRKCTIKIFTSSGRFVQKLTHQATEENRRASWNLRTKDGLEIASGMYFYAVEAPGIGVKTGKFAVVK